MTNHRARSVPRGGLTLVEVILVMALLVVIAAVVAPTLEGTLTRARLHSAGDLLRAAWMRARLAAMEAGTPYVFRCQPHASQYQIVRLANLGEEGEAGELPEGIVFAAADVAASTRLLATIEAAVDPNWSAPILFHPDGTASDASVQIANDLGQTLRVTLRGLTGISHAGEVENEASR